MSCYLCWRSSRRGSRVSLFGRAGEVQALPLSVLRVELPTPLGPIVLTGPADTSSAPQPCLLASAPCLGLLPDGAGASHYLCYYHIWGYRFFDDLCIFATGIY